MLDQTLRQIEQGQIGAVEAIDVLLTEELTLRQTRRVKIAVDYASTLLALYRSFTSPMTTNHFPVAQNLSPRSRTISGGIEFPLITNVPRSSSGASAQGERILVVDRRIASFVAIGPPSDTATYLTGGASFATAITTIGMRATATSRNISMILMERSAISYCQISDVYTICF